MPLPTELSADKTDRLRPPHAEVPEEIAARPGRRARASRLGRRAVRTILGERLSSGIRARFIEPRRRALEAIQRVERLELEVHELRRRTQQLEEIAQSVPAMAVNLQLLKGEVRSGAAALDELGMAIAPATGLEGAAARLSELRERLNGLDRRIRSLMAASPSDHAAAPEGQSAAPESALFDYVGFERRFRGDPAVVDKELARRYLDRLVAHPPVVDIGCGNAGLVAMLAARGIEAIGVDTDPSMVAEAQARGLDVHLMTGTDFLRDQSPGSLGAIIATHVVEHLPLRDLVELLELAASRLRAGGLFIAETPNPASLIVLGNSYVLDPTHVRPLHASLLTFLCEGAGFHDVRLEFYAPATAYHLPLVDDPGAPDWLACVNEAFGKLNRVLFGPQEYAIIATAAPSDHEDTQAS